jgi:hypothetical protein
MKIVSRDQMIAKIRSTNGSIFSVLYEKVRSNGEIRKVNCRLGVQKFLKGTGKSASPEAQIVVVYDLQKAGYRSLASEGILEATIAKMVYKIK